MSSTANDHPRAKERNAVAEQVAKPLADLAEHVWAMPVREEQDLINRALIADYHSDRQADGSLTDLFSVCPPDAAMAHLMVAVLARNGIEPGHWGPARGKRSIAAARGQPQRSACVPQPHSCGT